jgi:hypothetical protein
LLIEGDDDELDTPLLILVGEGMVEVEDEVEVDMPENDEKDVNDNEMMEVLRSIEGVGDEVVIPQPDVWV